MSHKSHLVLADTGFGCYCVSTALHQPDGLNRFDGVNLADIGYTFRCSANFGVKFDGNGYVVDALDRYRNPVVNHIVRCNAKPPLCGSRSVVQKGCSSRPELVVRKFVVRVRGFKELLCVSHPVSVNILRWSTIGVCLSGRPQPKQTPSPLHSREYLLSRPRKTKGIGGGGPKRLPTGSLGRRGDKEDFHIPPVGQQHRQGHAPGDKVLRVRVEDDAP